MNALLPIFPSDIDTDRSFFDAFGNYETEVSAHWLVRFCRERNGNLWTPFTFGALTAYYQELRLGAMQREWDRNKAAQDEILVKNPDAYVRWIGNRPADCDESFHFNRLFCDEWIIFSGPMPQTDLNFRLNPETLITVSPKFVLACLKSSPASRTLLGQEVPE